ncbi:MAG: hypothetical protein N2202_03300 [Proteobacteria bacterium]|nr:hypothetical protein [Pseudomonadota bacterium]
MNSVLLLEKEGFSYVNIEKKQGIITLSGFERFGYEGIQLFQRKGTELSIECEYITKLLNLLSKKTSEKRRELNIILPYSITWYYTLNVEDIPKNRDELYDFVMWKIGKIIPIPKEQIEMRIDIISKMKEQTVLLIAITFKTFIIELERCLRESGFVSPLIVPPSIAILNTIEPLLTENCLILWLKEKGFSMMVFADATPRYIRELDQTLPIERIEAELYSFLSTIRRNEDLIAPERILYFDEVGREDIGKYLPEKSNPILLSDLKIQTNIQENLLRRFVIAAGVIS